MQPFNPAAQFIPAIEQPEPPRAYYLDMKGDWARFTEQTGMQIGFSDWLANFFGNSEIYTSGKENFKVSENFDTSRFPDNFFDTALQGMAYQNIHTNEMLKNSIDTMAKDPIYGVAKEKYDQFLKDNKPALIQASMLGMIVLGMEGASNTIKEIEKEHFKKTVTEEEKKKLQELIKEYERQKALLIAAECAANPTPECKEKVIELYSKL